MIFIVDLILSKFQIEAVSDLTEEALVKFILIKA